MTKYIGNPAHGGLVRGPAWVLGKQKSQIIKRQSEDPEFEIKRIGDAIECSKKQIRRICEEAVRKAGTDGAAIFEAHEMMLEDEEYLSHIIQLIRSQGANAEYAADMTGKLFAGLFAKMDDEYMKARAVDVLDITDRLVKNLTGMEDYAPDLKDASVVIAEDITPSELVQLRQDKMLALVTIHGSVNSHMAILARMMNIPAVVAVPIPLDDIQSGIWVEVDAYHGEVILGPSGM